MDLPVGDEAPLQASPVREGEEVLQDQHKVIVREMLRPTKKQLSQFQFFPWPEQSLLLKYSISKNLFSIIF